MLRTALHCYVSLAGRGK